MRAWAATAEHIWRGMHCFRKEEENKKKLLFIPEWELSSFQQHRKARCLPIKVGCTERHRALSVLGITGRKWDRATKKITNAAEKASRWPWI